jgi:hypothetical protein
MSARITDEQIKNISLVRDIITVNAIIIFITIIICDLLVLYYTNKLHMIMVMKVIIVLIVIVSVDYCNNNK